MAQSKRSLSRPSKAYHCEWGCDFAARSSLDYVRHVIAKHDNGAQRVERPLIGSDRVTDGVER